MTTSKPSEPFEPDLEMWDAWTPQEAARLLSGVEVPWYVAAGWAIDLFLGGRRREHGDLEISVPQTRFTEVASALEEAGFEIFVPVEGPGNGLVWPIAQAEQLMLDPEHHQTWVREPGTGQWRMDIFREPADATTWIFRRDERIRLPYSSLIEYTVDGIPYVCPEANLLFKAKHAHLEKNQGDFAAVLPLLDPGRRRWLREALTLAHPEHPWIDELT